MMSKFIKKIVFYKNDIVYVSLIMVLLLAYFSVTKPAYNRLLYQYQDSVKTFKNDLKIKESLEGKKLEEIVLEKSGEILNNSYNQNYFLLIILNNITCYTCIKFHLEEIERINKIGLPVYSIAFDKQQLVKSYINNAIGIEVTRNSIKLPFNYELLILLIDKNGNILKADIADKNNYLKSEIFYNIIVRYVKE